MDLTRPRDVVATLAVGLFAFASTTGSTSQILAAGELIGSQRTVAAAAPELQAIHARVGINYGDDFVIAEPVGPDVRLRVVRVASANEWCPGVLVQAIEKVLPRTTVQAVARLRVCAITDRRVATARSCLAIRAGSRAGQPVRDHHPVPLALPVTSTPAPSPATAKASDAP
jgi:hypothetical protein